MKKVLVAAPFETNGRFKGGITSFVHSIFALEHHFSECNISLEAFNTCLIKRSSDNRGKLDFQNLVNTLVVSLKLNLKLLSVKPDIVHLHSSFGNGLLKDLLILKCLIGKSKCELVLHVHFAEYELIMPKKGWKRKLAKRIMKNTIDKVVLLSTETEKEFVEQGISNTYVVYNFVSNRLEERDMEEKIQITGQKKMVDLLFMGSIDKRKGVLDLLNSVNQMSSDNYRLHICGKLNEDSIEKEYRDLIKKNEAHIIEHGFVVKKEKDDILKNTDVFILPSYAEGLPISILEAFSQGAAAVVTNVGANPEVVDSTCGMLIEPGDVENLCQCLDKCVREHDFRSGLMEGAYKRSLDFTPEVFVKNMTAVYKDKP